MVAAFLVLRLRQLIGGNRAPPQHVVRKMSTQQKDTIVPTTGDKTSDRISLRLSEDVNLLRTLREKTLRSLDTRNRLH
jgi:hypothetical protein